MAAGTAEPYEIEIADAVLDDLGDRLRATRWDPTPGPGWDFGADQAYLRELCAFWAEQHDWRPTEARLNAMPNFRFQGIHFLRLPGEGPAAASSLPIVLLHGWPGGPIEFLELIPLLVSAGHEVIVPSLPGYAFSEPPEQPLNVAAMAGRLETLIADGLGLDRVIVQGGDWGAILAGRIAFDRPDLVAGLHLNAPFVLPVPGDLGDPPLTTEEQEYAQRAMRSMSSARGSGYHLVPQGRSPDALAAGMTDSPAGLAAWLVEKYRNWSDCDGEVERRFSKGQLCDYLTMYWATGTVGSAMRLYGAEARDRWRLGPGERIAVPCAVANFPKELLRTPRSWSQRIVPDIRSWTEMPRGGHFAAHEEPQLLADDLLAFAASL